MAACCLRPSGPGGRYVLQMAAVEPLSLRDSPTLLMSLLSICRFVFAVMSFTPSYTAVTGWHNERYLVKKELQQRQYGVTAMYLSRTIVTTPFQCMQCLVFVAILCVLSFVGCPPPPMASSGVKGVVYGA